MVEDASVANAAFKRLIFSELNPSSKGGFVHVSVRRRMLAARLRILTVPGTVRILKQAARRTVGRSTDSEIATSNPLDHQQATPVQPIK
jgi:hypothetical protein